MDQAIYFVIITVCVLALAYRFYGIFFVNKVLAADDKEVTPSHILADGKNYVPTKKWVNAGQHFAAIAGIYLVVGGGGYWRCGAQHRRPFCLHETPGQIAFGSGQGRARAGCRLEYRPGDAVHHHNYHGRSFHRRGACA